MLDFSCLPLPITPPDSRCLFVFLLSIALADHNHTGQVAEQLQRAVEGAADGPAIATALKVTCENERFEMPQLTCFFRY